MVVRRRTAILEALLLAAGCGLYRIAKTLSVRRGIASKVDKRHAETQNTGPCRRLAYSPCAISLEQQSQVSRRASSSPEIQSNENRERKIEWRSVLITKTTLGLVSFVRRRDSCWGPWQSASPTRKWCPGKVVDLKIDLNYKLLPKHRERNRYTIMAGFVRFTREEIHGDSVWQEKLDGKYALGELIASGGFGAVFHCTKKGAAGLAGGAVAAIDEKFVVKVFLGLIRKVIILLIINFVIRSSRMKSTQQIQNCIRLARLWNLRRATVTRILLSSSRYVEYCDANKIINLTCNYRPSIRFLRREAKYLLYLSSSME